MRRKTTAIPVNQFRGEVDTGILIDKIAFDNLPDLADWGQPERHDRHSFFLLEQGAVTIEIDFQKYEIKSPSVIYLHPDQVHRILGFENVVVGSWALNNESLNPEYLHWLEDITPAAPQALDRETFDLISEAVSLCMKFANRKKDHLHHSLLKDSCNALVGLVISRYIDAKPADNLSRLEIVTKGFREILERNYKISKSPAAYAELLHISTPYLNECVKNTTGYPVSYHIQQRVILEAKRLLYHSGSSVKEIAAMLGYDDYPYFSRLFAKVTGVSALAFRNKNLD